jgi:hypothetical protein
MSLERLTTAAAVSSQVVSMASRGIGSQQAANRPAKETTHGEAADSFTRQLEIRLLKEPATAGSVDGRSPKTSAFWGVAQVDSRSPACAGKGHGGLFPWTARSRTTSQHRTGSDCRRRTHTAGRIHRDIRHRCGRVSRFFCPARTSRPARRHCHRSRVPDGACC